MPQATLIYQKHFLGFRTVAKRYNLFFSPFTFPHFFDAVFSKKRPGPDAAHVSELHSVKRAIRKGGLLALKWEDVDLDAERLTVNKAVAFHYNSVSIKTLKTKAGIRTVPIPKKIIPLLQKAKDNAESEYVCPSVKGEIMTHTAYNVAWNSYPHYLNLKAGGRDASRSRPKVQALKEFSAHQLRHTMVSILYDAGVDVKSAQKFLGYSDIQVTLKIYTQSLGGEGAGGGGCAE